MTDSDIGSDKHRSSPEIKLAVLEERMKEARERDRVLLESNAKVVNAIGEIKTMLALGEQRMKAIETSQEDTTDRLLAIENDKRTAVGFWGTIANAVGVIGSYIK